MKKLFEINTSLNYGAPGRIAEQIGILANDEGWSVCVAHGERYTNPSQLPHYAMTTKWGAYVHAMGARLFDFHGLMSTSETNKLVDYIKDFKPDVIHLHNIHGYFCNFKVLFEYLDTVDIPVVWTMHDCWPFTGRCVHFEGINCMKWKTGCYDCKAKAGYTVSAFCDRSRELYDLKKRLFTSVPNLTMVPVSDWLASYLKDSFLKNCRIQTIHNGVDLKRFKPMDCTRLRQKHEIGNRFVVLGVAAPWSESKGLYDFVRLRGLLPKDEYAIVMVGLNKEQIEKLPQGIIGVARTQSQKQLAEYYSMADCFANLTYNDNFPTVNVEALACGTSVITYNTGGSPEAVDDRTGVVVPQGDVDAMATTIRQLNEHPLLREDCRRRAEEKFDKNECFRQYIKLYNKLIHNNLTGGGGNTP